MTPSTVRNSISTSFRMQGWCAPRDTRGLENFDRDTSDAFEAHSINLVRHRAHSALDGLVAGMVGLSERASGVVRRRQPAGSLIPLVFSFGNSLAVDSLTDATGSGRSYASFVAGLSTGWASTR